MIKYIIALATRFIPRHQLQKVAHTFMKAITPFYTGNNFEDPIDGRTYRKLLPYGRISPRQNALAPYSMSLERHRLLWLFLKQKTDFFTRQARMLHVAPEYCFIPLFRRQKNIDYITGDLISPWADVKMDVQAIPFDDNSFDVIMCNHVLEHVPDDKKAMSEFFRVMKPGGWGIFEVPVDYSNPKTLEDPAYNTPELREKHYWQDDHLRLYGLDYADKLRSVGFDVTEDNMLMEFTPEQRKRYAFPPQEIIYLCKKPQ